MTDPRPDPPRPPGRPAGFDRDAALEAAMDLFWKRGYGSVTARDLAAAMSIQRSSFYNSFGSKEAVFREALPKYAGLAPDAALDRFEPDQPAIPLLVAVFREACRVRAADSERRGCLACNSLAELVGVDPELGALLEDAANRRIASIERVLEAGTAQGDWPEGADLATDARTLVAFLIGLNTLSKVVRGEDELWANCDRLLASLGVARELLDGPPE